MLIFYDPADMQVMALYSGTCSGSVWEDLGYIPLVLGASESDTMLLKTLRRNCYITLIDGEISGVHPRENPIQPKLNIEEVARVTVTNSARRKLRGLGLTDPEINALRSH